MAKRDIGTAVDRAMTGARFAIIGSFVMHE
jgi:hypothetical protein